MRRVLFVLGLIMTAFTCGCANMQTVEGQSAEEGTTKIFKYPPEDVKAATLESVQSLNVTIKSTAQEGDSFRILFSKSISAWSWGEVGSVIVKPLDTEGTLVSVNSEKRDQFQITGTDEQEFAAAIFSGIEKRLDGK